MSIPVNRATMVADYQVKYDNLKVTRTAAVEVAAKLILAGWERYLKVEDLTGVPAELIGALHYRESSCDFRGCLANGQYCIGNGRSTTIEPKGAGPWGTWEDSAVWALKHEGLDKVADWSPGDMLFSGEVLNGEGYHFHGWPNPYLFAGTQYYTAGKYVSDGVYNPNVIDPQLGIAAIIKRVREFVNADAEAIVISADPNTGKLHPADHAAVVANSRFLRATDWYTNFCHWMGLSWVLLLSTVSQLQPYLTDWKTLTLVALLGGAYFASRVGAFNLTRAAAQGRYTPSGLALSPVTATSAQQPVVTAPAPAPVSNPQGVTASPAASPTESASLPPTGGPPAPAPTVPPAVVQGLTSPAFTMEDHSQPELV